jgi:chromosome segregation ATPase
MTGEEELSTISQQATEIDLLRARVAELEEERLLGMNLPAFERIAFRGLADELKARAERAEAECDDIRERWRACAVVADDASDRIDELEHYRQEAHEALECVSEDRSELTAEITRLRARGKVLVEALEKVTQVCLNTEYYDSYIIADARAAIASVQGETP